MDPGPYQIFRLAFASFAIMRRAHPYPGENSGPGKDDRGELDIQTRN
jgi:hypothetical protein